jgi:flagellar assembly factor FliW
MPRLSSKYFGELDYASDAVFQFPSGVPGFEHHTAFVFLEQPHADPLVFMQSLSEEGLCFIAIPVFVADAGYCLELPAEDREALGFSPTGELKIGEEILCLALVTVHEGSGPTANLASPIVLSLQTRLGLQSVCSGTAYALRHPLLTSGVITSCS